MVHLVVNVEYWPFDQPMPRSIIPAPPWDHADTRRPGLRLGPVRTGRRNAPPDQAAFGSWAQGQRVHERGVRRRVRQLCRTDAPGRMGIRRTRLRPAVAPEGGKRG